VNCELFKLVLRHLLANLEPNEALHEVIMGGLPEGLSDEDVAECYAILGKMLTALQTYAMNVFRDSSQNNN
jgi:hypothetical protein